MRKRRRNLLQSLLWQKFWTQRIWIWYWSWLFANDLKFRKKKKKIAFIFNAKHEPNIQTGRRSNERKKSSTSLLFFFAFLIHNFFFIPPPSYPLLNFFFSICVFFRISFLRFDNAAFLFILKNIFLHVKSAKYCVGNHIYKYCKLT